MPRNSKSTGLAELNRFGANPGNLRGLLFLPSILPPRAPLVVVLHGCTQTAAAYDQGSGWTQLAEAKGFAVLFAEQQRANNANLCFNWFEPADTTRHGGEAQSIAEMVGHVLQGHGLDSDRVWITGLSAGGAMANVMLATYPELFAGGAIIGGLPYGTAAGVGEAFERMHGRNPPSPAILRKVVTAASGHKGRWPHVTIWHGTHDQTVKPVNAEQIAEQWRGAHGIDGGAARTEQVNGHSRRVWTDRQGTAAVEVYLVKGMAHGVPLAPQAEAGLGAAGAYMLDAGISSTARIAARWGLIDAAEVDGFERGSDEVRDDASGDATGMEAIVAKAMEQVKRAGLRKDFKGASDMSQGVGKVINDALRRAGLMR